MKNYTFLYLLILLHLIGCQKETSEHNYDYEINFAKLSNQKDINAFGLEIEEYHRVKINKELEIVGDSIFTLTPLENKIKNVRLLNISRTSLHNFEGLDSIESINNINLSNNLFLEDFSIIFLDTDIQIIQITKNTKLGNLSGLKNVEIVGELYLIDNDNLENLGGLQNLTKIDEINLENNDRLFSLDGIESIEGNMKKEKVKLKAYDNIQLWDYCALNMLVSMDRIDFTAYGNSYNPKFEDLKKGSCRLIDF